jgi:O-methyltransferase involved in polyketide biosynthesis
MLISLYFRAVESMRPDGLVKDPHAEAICNQLEYDFTPFQKMKEDQTFTALRIRQFDCYVKSFLDRQPVGTVVHIGCGLDTRFERLDNGKVRWFDMDLPEVIQNRTKLIPKKTRAKIISKSVFDTTWMNEVSKTGGPYLFISEGVFVYLAPDDVKKLVLQLRDTFPGCELVIDAMSRISLRMHNSGSILKRANTSLKFSLRNAKEMETWGIGIKHLGTWYYFDDIDERTRNIRWMKWIPGLNNINYIVHYQLG